MKLHKPKFVLSYKKMISLGIGLLFLIITIGGLYIATRPADSNFIKDTEGQLESQIIRFDKKAIEDIEKLKEYTPTLQTEGHGRSDPMLPF